MTDRDSPAGARSAPPTAEASADRRKPYPFAAAPVRARDAPRLTGHLAARDRSLEALARLVEIRGRHFARLARSLEAAAELCATVRKPDRRERGE